MHYFRFLFKDRYLDFEEINKVEYVDVLGETITVSENELLEHNYPTDTNIYLYSPKQKHSVAGEDIISISVTKQD